MFTRSAPSHPLDFSTGAARAGLEALAAWPTAGAGWFEDRILQLAELGVGWAGALLATLGAAGIGATHALAPGHAKTVTAAYLAGGAARVRHAVAVGGVVAVMHTATAVVLAGTLVLLQWSPDLGPAACAALTITAGVVLVVLGISMQRRRPGRSVDAPGHDHRLHHHRQEPHHQGGHRSPLFAACPAGPGHRWRPAAVPLGPAPCSRPRGWRGGPRLACCSWAPSGSGWPSPSQGSGCGRGRPTGV